MAARYWVGGTGTWNSSNTTNWATSPGGSGGASAPTSTDDVWFNNQSGTGTVTVATGAAAQSLNTGGFTPPGTGYTGTITGTGALSFSGPVSIFSGTTWSYSGNMTLTATNNLNYALISSGKTLANNLNINAAAGTITLLDTLTLTGDLTFTAGTFTTGNNNISAAGYALSTVSAKTINLGSSTVTATGSGTCWSFGTTTGLTFNRGTSTIVLSNTGTSTFAGGALTYYNLTIGGLASQVTITGNNTFNNITNTVQPASVLFAAGTTTTFTNFNLNGTAGNLITIGSATAASHTLSKASGTVSVNYVSISRSTATGGAIWNAVNSSNGLNNTGWVFTSTIPNIFFGSGITIGNGITLSA